MFSRPIFIEVLNYGNAALVANSWSKMRYTRETSVKIANAIVKKCYNFKKVINVI